MPEGIPQRAARSLVEHLVGTGTPTASAEAFVAALSADLASGVPGTTALYDRLAARALPASAARVRALSAEIVAIANAHVPMGIEGTNQ